MKTKLFFLIIATLMLYLNCSNNPTKTRFDVDEAKHSVDVFINDIYFTSFIYPDNMEKQSLYPIKTPSGKSITRGFPLDPRPFERTDHPHHVGLWFNFGDVNGLDFWNNSYSIKPEDKNRYGTILFDKIAKTDPKKGELTVLSNWVDNDRKVLLKEKAIYIFDGINNDLRTIERITELTAEQPTTFTENKEGLLGLRVGRVFEEPSKKPEKFLDANGIVTETPVLNNDGVNGVYRNAEGLTGGDVWGKRSKWVALKATDDGEVITIVILDNKNNPNYPAWSHARGYGLFASNNLAGRAVDSTVNPVKLELLPGEKVIFKHKILIGGNVSDAEINKFSDDFNK